METPLDERVPRGGSTIVTVFALPGALIGLLLWLLWEGSRFIGPDASAATFLVFGGGTYLLTVLKGQVARAGLVSACLGLFTAALTFIAHEGQAASVSSGALPFLASLGIVGVALPFIRAASKGERLNHYPPLYADAWNLPVIIGVAQLFVLAGAALAALVAALFVFIGLPFLRELMSEGWFMTTYCGLLQGVGIGVARQREAAILAARGIKMALLRVTAPIFAFCVTVFVGAVMLRGFGGLLDGLSPLAVLTAAATVAIIMINAIVGEEGRPKEVLFGATARLLGVILLFLMALAVYGLYLRVSVEGWTPNRIMAGVFVTVVALYAPLYAAAALAERWAILRQGNIALSVLLLLIAVFVQSPLFKPYDWSVKSQVAILKAEPKKATASDLAYLRDRLGVPGEEAFEALKEGEGVLAERARDLPQNAIVFAGDLKAHTEDMIAQDRLLVLPQGSELPEEMLGVLDNLLRPGSPAAVLQLTPSRDEAWLFYRIAPKSALIVSRIEGVAGTYRSFREIEFFGAEADAVLAAAQRGELAFETRSYRLPVIGGNVLNRGAKPMERYRLEEDGEAAPSGLGGEPETSN